MPMKVNIIIDPKTARVEFEVEGVVGGACTEITQALVKGHEVLDEELTEDYFSVENLPQYIGNPEE